MKKQIINPAGAPEPVGAYSPAVRLGDIVFISGQVAQGDNIPNDVAEQTRMALTNLLRLVEAAGLTKENVGMVNVYLRDINDFDKMNSVYQEYFQNPFPARAAIETKMAGEDLLVEISAVCVAERT